ncbi:hypothetical protein BD410DRAFT_480164 [Rickenella mellea]|uniref:Uncharacterized protein n=1 Tax=Rickenella mellea TaxID=50990 RepID=A0A4Y7QH54_9AGAM|nr:hypothetical protein BD410DRAFT_480164 [Rickenella mellea]
MYPTEPILLIVGAVVAILHLYHDNYPNWDVTLFAFKLEATIVLPALVSYMANLVNRHHTSTSPMHLRF